MATAEVSIEVGAAPATGQTRHNGARPRLHRIHTVRTQQGVSLRSAARRLGTDSATVRAQDDETADLRLSDLYRWQQILEVPITDLLVDPGTPLSRPVMERACMVRLMKTVLALREQADSAPVQRLAETLVNQLVELMPELEHVTPWHSVGQRRSKNEMGRIAECPVPDLYLGLNANSLDE